MNDLIYLDYAATTPVDPQVAELLGKLFASTDLYANPSAVHLAGRRAQELVDRAARQLGELIGADPSRLIWTSGATESNNLAIAGAAAHRERRGRHLVTMPTEHKAVSDVFRQLERRGFDVTWLAPDGRGRLDIEALANSLTSDTQLVSVMYVNNETGVVQDIDAIGRLCRERDILFHVDAAQALGKLPLDVARQPIDLLSVTAHKLYGPKGIGALYVADRPGCHLEPLLFGGPQQRRLRPGTLPVPLIAAFGLAAEIAQASMQRDLEHVAALREQLWQGLQALDGIRLNGDPVHHYPGILNVSAADVEGESLLLALEPVCVATGSACNSLNQEPSAVLRAMGLRDAEAESAIRFSFGRPTSPAEVDAAVQRYVAAVTRLRALAPERAA